MKRTSMISRLAMLVFTAGLLSAADWKPLFNGKNLDGWEITGDGVWTVLEDGTLVGQRSPRKTIPKEWPWSKADFQVWENLQSWLYTKAEFHEFDLQLDYWLRMEGNSGIGLRDPSRGKYASTMPPDFKRTPARIAYEIQLNNQYPDPHPSGSIYGFQDAKTGVQKDHQWNTIHIESRDSQIRVEINGVEVARHPGDPARPKAGPIGLQLHDQFSVSMFRNIRIRVVDSK